MICWRCTGCSEPAVLAVLLLMHCMQLQSCSVAESTHPRTQATADMQGSYQYWGAKMFSYLHATSAGTYLFAMTVDDAARLWIDGALVIDATCTPHARHPQQHVCCIHVLTPVPATHPVIGWTCTLTLKALWQGHHGVLEVWNNCIWSARCLLSCRHPFCFDVHIHVSLLHDL